MIRLAKIEDLDQIMKIYEYARNYMKEHGNPAQWGCNRSSRDTIEKDIKNQNFSCKIKMLMYYMMKMSFMEYFH